MTAALRALWQSRSPRERQAWIGVLVLATVALYLALVGAAMQSREPLRQEVEALRADVARMDLQASELAQLRSSPPPAAPTGDLRAGVQSSLDAAGLPRDLAKLDAPDPEQVNVVFDAVAFSDVLRWLGSVDTRQFRLASCRIQALPASGMVSVTATLARSAPP